MSLILTNIEGRVGTIVLNRPEKRNALSAELVAELKQAFLDFNSDENVKIILLKSAALPFCAGADLAYLTQLRNFTFDENVADSQHLKELFELIYTSPKITISQVEGPALAGGCGLATVTDFCFASIEATFGYTEAKIGFLPALVMVYLREKVGMQVMTDWLLTGRVFGADEAFNCGLIYQVSASDEIEKHVNDFISKLTIGVSQQSIEGIKKMMRNLPFDRKEALNYAAEMNAHARATLDCKKGIDAFLNKEKITW
jgi:methylglutaconyl-CoA hydratase